ncbi:MAG: xanthine dehydrogenase family protein molybdopterin-binding subunit [Lachnospiraceae bacterium]
MLGKSKAIWDANLKVTGRKIYVADMKLPGMLYGKILFSPVAHAKIISINTQKAEEMPGVHGVVTYKNTPQTSYNSAQRFIDHQVIRNEKIFDDTVRFIGDRVAAVAAESEEIASAAIKAIEVEYEMLSIQTTIREAMDPQAYPIHPGGNRVAALQAGRAEEEMEGIWGKCDHILEGEYETPAIHHGAIEPHTALADWTPENKLTVYSPNQNCFAFRVILSEIFALPYNKIRVIAPAIGGAFGGKLELTVEPVAAILSRLTGRPVRIVLTRRETMMASRVRHGSLSYVKTGFMKDGTIAAMQFRLFTNTGAYASSALNVAGALTHKILVAYKVPFMRIEAVPVYTNTMIAGAMRGYGSPQVYFGMQRQVYEVARFLQKDPTVIQRINMVEPTSLNAVTQKPIGNPRPLDCLERAMELMDYQTEYRNCHTQKEEQDVIYGIGSALGVHGNNCFGVHRDNASPMIKMNEDGSCILYTGSHEMGTDTIGMQKQILTEILSIPDEHIDIVATDTDACLWHIGDYSSRGVFVIGAAAKAAAVKMREELCIEAAKLLKVAPEEIELADNMAFSTRDPQISASLKEVMLYCQSVSKRELCVYETYEAPRAATSYGVHMAKVRIEKRTGKVTIDKYVAVHDIGFAINPQMLEGQLHGGIHMGLGYALSEEMQFDESGRPSPLVLKQYGFLKATEMPGVLLSDFITKDGGEPGGPFGAKALGECPVVPVAPAVVNAICDALGADFNTLPVTPDKIKAHLEASIKKEM